jgi:hypothetical protein
MDENSETENINPGKENKRFEFIIEETVIFIWVILIFILSGFMLINTIFTILSILLIFGLFGVAYWSGSVMTKLKHHLIYDDTLVVPTLMGVFLIYFVIFLWFYRIPN